MNINTKLLPSLFAASAFAFAAPAFAEGDNGEHDNDSNPCDNKDEGDNCEQDDGDNGECEENNDGTLECLVDEEDCEAGDDCTSGGDDKDTDVDVEEANLACGAAGNGSALALLGVILGVLPLARRRR